MVRWGTEYHVHPQHTAKWDFLMVVPNLQALGRRHGYSILRNKESDNGGEGTVNVDPGLIGYIRMK